MVTSDVEHDTRVTVYTCTALMTKSKCKHKVLASDIISKVGHTGARKHNTRVLPYGKRKHNETFSKKLSHGSLVNKGKITCTTLCSCDICISITSITTYCNLYDNRGYTFCYTFVLIDYRPKCSKQLRHMSCFNESRC